MKLKKILSSLTCLLILLAFAGAIGLEFGSVSLPKPLTEVSPANMHGALNLSLISEERDDADDQQHLNALPVELFLSETIFFISSHYLFSILSDFTKPVPKNALFINFRSLRL